MDNHNQILQKINDNDITVFFESLKDLNFYERVKKFEMLISEKGYESYGLK
jgi:hypothetical protein